MATPQTITLSVPDVSCEHCVKTVTDTLTQQPSIQDVKVDLNAKTVSFTYDPERVNMTDIETALDDAGYPVAK
jgi:copper chaperone